jgi:hypothetical protein
MWLLQKLYRKDPLEQWQHLSAVPLTFNLSYRTVNNICLGDSYEKLIGFGRPDNPKPLAVRSFNYYKSGFMVKLEGSKIDFFAFVFDGNPDKNFKPCELQVLGKNGALMNLDRQAIQSEIEIFFGVPQQRDRDAEEIILVYTQDNVRMEFEFNKEERLQRLKIFHH